MNKYERLIMFLKLFCILHVTTAIFALKTAGRCSLFCRQNPAIYLLQMSGIQMFKDGEHAPGVSAVRCIFHTVTTNNIQSCNYILLLRALNLNSL